MDRQTTLLYCLYIYRYKVKWIAGDGVLWKYLICLYWLWLITSLYCLYICKRYKVKWCKGDGLVMWQIFSSFRCKKIILLMLMRWVQTTPSFLFFRQSLSSSSCAPQWFFLPVAWWEAQCAEVNFGIFCEESLHLVRHVISGRYDIEEVLDDAHVKIDSECIRGQVYPCAYNDVWHHGTQCVLLVPYTSMMAT